MDVYKVSRGCPVTVTTNIRSHLLNAHGVVVKEEDLVIKRAIKQSL